MDNMEFEYKVSVIVPVYNVEKYLRDCLDSLLAQTIDHELMEVLLINDGSTDNSLAICEEYAELFECFKVFDQENKGPSAARNVGIKNAKGKYIAFLDSDDTFDPQALKLLVDFFDKHYNEINLVTCYDEYFLNGKKLPPHVKYKYLTKTGIYDLNETIFAFQLRLSICYKNQFEENILFDEEVRFQEDQQFCSKILKDNVQIGYVKEAVYNYMRNDNGLVASSSYPLYSFESTMKFFEDLFSEYEESVPRYFQALFFHDLSWKIKENVLFPYHYEGEEYAAALNRIQALIDRVDDEVILSHPSTDSFHRHFFLNMKSDAKKAVVTPLKNKISIYKESKLLYNAEKFEIILNKITVKNSNLKMLAFLKSPIFNYIEAPKIEAVITYNDNTVQNINLDFFLSSWSWYKSKEKTNNFYGFYFNCDADNVSSFKIQVVVDGIRYDTYYWFMSTSPFSLNTKHSEALLSNYKVEFEDNVFYISKLSENELLSERKAATEKLNSLSSIYGIRCEADKMINKKIWLYYDCIGVEKDNGYYQFIHDINKDDGIDRFYVSTNEEIENTDLFSESQKKFIVHFGSLKHKILYTAASKIITAYVEDRNINPFSSQEHKYIADILNFEIIYLQHGILHAHIPWKYSPGRVDCNCDKIVISSLFEKENLTNIYHFPLNTLIGCGMPRFDHIDRNTVPSNKILFAPSWRNYLIGKTVGNEWTLTEHQFVNSDYFKIFNEFLNAPELEEVLAENDIYLDFKIHPIFMPYLHFFDNNNTHVSFAGGSVKDEEYAAFITDFSSFVFDFAYLKRPIMYFVPDYLQVKSGMNQYRELDLPFEKAFGKMVTDVESAINEISDIIKNDFNPNSVFEERMNNFYLPLKNCSEKLYQYLLER